MDQVPSTNKEKDCSLILPVNTLVHVPVHLLQQDCQLLLGLLGGQFVEAFGLLPGPEDGLVVEGCVVVAVVVVVVTRTKRSVGLTLTVLIKRLLEKETLETFISFWF